MARIIDLLPHVGRDNPSLAETQSISIQDINFEDPYQAVAIDGADSVREAVKINRQCRLANISELGDYLPTDWIVIPDNQNHALVSAILSSPEFRSQLSDPKLMPENQLSPNHLDWVASAKLVLGLKGRSKFRVVGQGGVPYKIPGPVVSETVCSLIFGIKFATGTNRSERCFGMAILRHSGVDEHAYQTARRAVINLANQHLSEAGLPLLPRY